MKDMDKKEAEIKEKELQISRMIQQYEIMKNDPDQNRRDTSFGENSRFYGVSRLSRDEDLFVCDSHLNRFSQNSHAFDNCHHNYPPSSPPCFWEYLLKL